jgi:hypothetical protein
MGGGTGKGHKLLLADVLPSLKSWWSPGDLGTLVENEGAANRKA